MDNMADKRLVVDMRHLDSLVGSQLDDTLGLDSFQVAHHMVAGQVLDIVVVDTFADRSVEELNDSKNKTN